MFKDNISEDQVITFINTLKVFKIGMSWGGVNSLAIIYPDLKRPDKEFSGSIVRLNIGLEQATDLIADLSQAIERSTQLEP